jgi:hypothetical protein
MKKIYRISFRDDWNSVDMEKCFISPIEKVIKISDHHDFASKYVMENYPGKEQYGDPEQRLILDGWIKIDNNSAELLEDKIRQLKNYLLYKHYDKDAQVKLYLWSGLNQKYEKITTIKDIINNN